MAISDHTIGFVYVLTNCSMPSKVKVGRTNLLPEDRAKQLDTTGVPEPFETVYRMMTSFPNAVEKAAHRLLRKTRVRNSREFFSASVNEAIEAVRLAAIDVAGINSWASPGPHVLRSEDRLALSLEAGQIFALISYPDFEDALLASARVIDCWQAQSDGDLLEVFVADAPGHVAGYSTSDPGYENDPVPYLNRTNTAANGLMNGRERLLPGEKLVWLPAQGQASFQTSVVFDARDHCQVVSRTWSPRIGPHGLPFLLNNFSCEEVWPEAAHSIRAALNLPLPRSWAPRDNRGPEWQPVSSTQRLPEHWLPQLKPRPRKGR